MMKVPRPPPPINAAKVAVPITVTVATLNPDNISDIANGKRILNNLKLLDKPKDSAASKRLGSILVNPEYVF